MGGGAEGRLGHADHRDTELGVGMGAEAGPPVRVQVSEAVDHEQGHPGQAVQHRPQRRELAQVELARLVGLNLGHQLKPVSHQAGEAGIG